MVRLPREHRIELGDDVAEVGNAGEESGHGHPSRNVAERGVSAEKLVATRSGQSDFQSHIGRSLADEIAVQTIDARLIHGFEDARQLALEFLERQIANRVRHTILLRNARGERRFIVDTAAILSESQCHRLQIGRATLACQCDD